MKPARERILDAARRLFLKSGVEGVSIRRIAELVGVTPMAIYRHFKGREGIVDALVTEGFARWEAELAKAVSAPSTRGRVDAVLEAYREFALTNRRYFELMYLVPRAGVPAAPDSLRVTTSPSFSRAIAAMQELLHADPAASAIETGSAILALWSTVHGLITLHLSGRFGHDDALFRREYDKVTKLVLARLLPESPRG